MWAEVLLLNDELSYALVYHFIICVYISTKELMGSKSAVYESIAISYANVIKVTCVITNCVNAFDFTNYCTRHSYCIKVLICTI